MKGGRLIEMNKLLNDNDIAAYKKLGVYSPVKIFSSEDTAAIRGYIEALEHEHGPLFTEDRPRPGKPIQGSFRFKSHLLFKWLADVIRNPIILDAVEDILGPDILCWSTHWIIKEANSPKFISWHQDSEYWGVETDDFVSVWLAISRASIESGCLRVFPGSHKSPAMTHVDTWAEENMLTRGQTIENFDEESVINLELAPGEAALFDYRLAHSSNPNQSDDRRIGLGIRYIPPTARQVRVDWDSATLVRGNDRHGHFELEPEPERDFDPIAVSFHDKADETQRKIFYAGAKPPIKAAE